MPEPWERRFFLVYQGGIANVFEVNCLNLSDYGRNARRLLQSDFRSCELFAQGLKEMGAIISSAYCNEAGDISNRTWYEDLNEAPFSEEFHPVYAKVASRMVPVEDRFGRRILEFA